MQRDNLLLAVARGSAKLVRARRWRRVMDEVLGDVGAAARVDRAWLFRLFAASEADVRFSIWHEWGAPGTAFTSVRNRPAFINVPMRDGRADYSVSVGAMLEGRPYICVDTRQLRPEQRRLSDELGIRSQLRMPVLRDGKVWGALGFDSVRALRPWLESEQEALAALSAILTAVLERERSTTLLWSEAAAGVPVALQAAAAAAAAELQQAPTLPAGIEAALVLVAMALHADRVWVTQNRWRSDGGMNSAIVQEWHRPELSPMRQTAIVEIDVTSAHRRWYETINAGEVLRALRAQARPDEAAAMDAVGVEQFVAVPVPGLLRRWQGTLNASRPADDPFTDAELRMLEAVADALFAASDRLESP